ncbi:MAG: FAD-binding oxidoreductase [Planctomycetes bacterium]|jgi:D-amino-acid oxidase|nr:FAD-binding oxidoreductase [Planctomycetota bacterium]
MNGSASSGGTQVVVLGAGVIGTCVALELRARGHAVRVLAKDDPEHTVSAVAGAIWYPFLAEPRQRVLAWSAATFRRLRAFAAVPGSGVHMQRVIEVFAAPAPEPWWASAVERVERVPVSELPAGAADAFVTEVPVCDVPVHLPWLRARALAAGVTFERRTVRSLGEAAALGPAVVNCTGLGAAALCDDSSLVPVRGQVVVVTPPPAAPALAAWIEDAALQPFYAIPRGGEVVLGGTAQPGNANELVDPVDTRAILAGIGARLPSLRGAALRAVKVGLRPYRPTVRLETEPHRGSTIVHCYGHGGSGYTLAWGCAEEVAMSLAR